MNTLKSSIVALILGCTVYVSGQGMPELHDRILSRVSKINYVKTSPVEHIKTSNIDYTKTSPVDYVKTSKIEYTKTSPITPAKTSIILENIVK